MKYKVGDRVRLISKPTRYMTAGMGKYLGKVVTISGMVTSVFGTDYYTVEEDDYKRYFEGMIAGLASETPFDFGAWKDKNVCMHCKTEEEAADFCKVMGAAGLRWINGDSYLLSHKSYRLLNAPEGLYYFFNKGTFSDRIPDKNKFHVLEWSDYRSTEPPKEEQEKTMETKSNDKPLDFKEAMGIYKRLCEYQHKKDACRECPVSSFKNYTNKVCRDFIIDNSDTAEPILKQWAAEHPVKTNEQKCNEMFLEVFGMQYATALMHPEWWQQEYVKPYKVKVE